MRLLRTPPLDSTEFPKLVSFSFEIPRYAILSHTWEHKEIEFPDLSTLGKAPHILSSSEKVPSLYKILGACRRARKDGFDYIWIDSCCINKDSSAELSEALNSMYQYYKLAAVCYVYLSDVCNAAEQNPRSGESDFRQCKWFTRGWALQELLAPSELVFFAKDWTKIGTKHSLHDAITAITGIPTIVLVEGDASSVSIAKKMSWAAQRKTTRPEDQAYCLMGIFSVNMPPIYGEGLESAFTRLQQEIIKYSNDRSIFAWTAASGHISTWEDRGLFANSPYEFRFSGHIGVSEWDFGTTDSSYYMTNSGLRIHLPLKHSEGDHLFRAFLSCRNERDGTHAAIYLRRTQKNEYSRCRANELILEPTMPGPKTLECIDVKGRRPDVATDTQMETDQTLLFLIRWYPHPDTTWLYNGYTFIHGNVGGGGSEKLLKLYVSRENPLTVYFTNKQDATFQVLVHVDKGLACANIGFAGAVATKDQKRLHLERVVKALPDNEMAILHLRKQPNKEQFRKLDIFIVPASPLIKDLDPTDFGVMIEIDNTVKRLFELRTILPADFFSQHYREERHHSVYCTIDPHRPFRILTFKPKSSGLGFSNFAVLLWIRNEKAAGWVRVVKDFPDADSNGETVESILEIVKDNFRKHKEDGENISGIKRGFSESSYIAKAGISRRKEKVLQPGTHVAWIKLGSYL
ncbi:hypothetical protein VKT23_000524 [Stygiomarasmius scandens]|uniref:Heterokaryon incompatibility domain-containing protein n=1 Tax=Marasmiellus scandens TaxID=2682957 RepID=A0ABR1K4C4_9AGAR